LRLLDLFCGQGGASMGYRRAGFAVTGVDVHSQPRYPFHFVHADALEYLEDLLDSGDIDMYDVITGSPPCQAFTRAQTIRNNDHPDLISPFRELVRRSGKIYIIENVPGSPLEDPVLLCGASFGLHTYRHRLFESNLSLEVPEHKRHLVVPNKMGRKLEEGDFYHAVGNFTSVSYVRKDMDVSWMNREGIRESIPPVYTEYLGRQVYHAKSTKKMFTNLS
jgi:DNA (cytosine-5)-methyltransferase 1